MSTVNVLEAVARIAQPHLDGLDCRPCPAQGLIGPLKRGPWRCDPKICADPWHGGHPPNTYLTLRTDDEDLTLYVADSVPTRTMQAEQIVWKHPSWADPYGRRWWIWVP